jgi:hypothetical protein
MNLNANFSEKAFWEVSVLTHKILYGGKSCFNNEPSHSFQNDNLLIY